VVSGDSFSRFAGGPSPGSVVKKTATSKMIITLNSKWSATTQLNVQAGHDEVSLTLVKKNGMEDFMGANKFRTIL
jgi:hypothetical protein